MHLFGSLHELHTLLGLVDEVRDHGIEGLLLGGREGAVGEHLLHTVGAEAHGGGEERSRGQGVLHEGALHNVLLAGNGGQQSAGELLASVGHGEGGRAGSVLSLHHLVTTELDAVGQGSDVSLRELATGNLREQGQDGGAGVTTDHLDVGGKDIGL